MTSKRARRAAAQPGQDPLPAEPETGQPRSGKERPSTAARASSAVRRAVRRSGDAAPAPAAAAAAQAAEDHGAIQGDVSSGFSEETAVVRRTKDGWRVGSDTLPDLTCAMVLADLLAAENGVPEGAPAKPSAESAANETGRLRATVGQLEHALATRIRVEQAIGVLAERHRIKPRQAFEQLRDAARSRGRRVIDIAGDVVASASNPLLQLPDELSRPRSGPRRARQQFGAQ
jgi:ANTAR domain